MASIILLNVEGTVMSACRMVTPAKGAYPDKTLLSARDVAVEEERAACGLYRTIG